MTTQTNIKAESIQTRSSATQPVVQPVQASAGLKIKTQVKAGGLKQNHNQKLVQSPLSAGLKIKTQVKAGSALANHNEKLVASAS